MAYQKKYYFTFKDLSTAERVHLIELWQNTAVSLTAEEVRGGMPPFVVEMPELDHKFQVVRGTGCTITLLSDTDMKFFNGLYHVDPQEFIVKHYIDSALNFIGYLNAEMITEPYDIDFNYQLSVTGNDGFSLMDRFAFVQADGSQYTGAKSKWELLQIVFGKIALSWSEILVSLSTTFTGYSGAANSTILHESYINCANFYDEDKKPMTLREVVEAILAPYGAYIRAESGNIYITDIHTLAGGGNITYKRFNASTYAYIASVTIDNEKTVSEIGYFGTGQSIEMSGGVNRHVVAYSPFPVKEILNDTLISAEEFDTVPGTFSTKDGYYYKTVADNKFWEIDLAKQVSLNPTTFEISYYQNQEDANVYLRIPLYAGVNAIVAYIKDNPFLTISGANPNPLSTDPDRPIRRRTKYYDGVAFLVTGEMLVKTRNNPYNESELPVQKDIISLGISCRIKCGGRYYDGSINSWTSSPANTFLYTNDLRNEVIADKFVKIGENGNGWKIIIGNFSEDIVLSGAFEFEFWSEYKTNKKNAIQLETNSTDVKEIWIKDLSINIVNFDGSEIQDNDIEFIGLLDKLYANEGEKIELKCGTDAQFADRGKIMKFDGTEYTDIKTWTRAGQTFKIEELLLNSLSSNYRAGFITLHSMKLKNSFSLQNVLTDSFIGTKKLMIKSANRNYIDHAIDCELVEIAPDELTIVKDPTIF